MVYFHIEMSTSGLDTFLNKTHHENRRRHRLKILLSPAKTQQFPAKNKSPLEPTNILYPKQKKLLLNTLKTKTPAELAKLYKIKEDKVEALFASYHTKPLEHQQAIETYTGIVFKSMEFEQWTPEMYEFAQQHTYIMSALYGALRPSDKMIQYRLDMSHKILPTEKTIHYWQPHINKLLKNEKTVINLASNEFTTLIEHPNMITLDFLDEKDGTYKRINTYVKMARGKMYQTIIKANIKTPEELKKLKVDGYIFSQSDSTANTFVFKRKNS